MRLHFSVIVGLALIALALPCRAAEAPRSKRDDSASEKLGMKLSLQCWTFNKLTFFETVDKATELGVKYVEMYPGQKLKPGSEVKVNRAMNENTIPELKKNLPDPKLQGVPTPAHTVPTP